MGLQFSFNFIPVRFMCYINTYKSTFRWDNFKLLKPEAGIGLIFYVY